MTNKSLLETHPRRAKPELKKRDLYAMRGAVGLGLLLRAWHYGRNPSMWHDEAATCVNIVHKSFGGLFGRLEYFATGSPFLLCMEKAVTLAFGDGTRSLRLVSFLASCAGLLLLVKLCRTLLEPPAAFCAVLLAACSDRLLWHACEARPYSSDFLLAVVLLLLFVKTAEWTVARRLALFAVCAPFVVLLSYPGVFLCSGLMLALLAGVRRDGRASAWAGWALVGAVVAASFAFFYFVTIKAQRRPEVDLAWMKMNVFPDLHKPWKLPFWAVASTVDIFDYYARPFAGGILAVPAVAGAIVFWREKKRELLVLILAPMAFALVAALVKSYPYAGTRTMVYSLPGLTLLIGAGLLPVIRLLNARLPAIPGRVLMLLLLFPFACTLVFSLYTAAVPWKRSDTAGASAYVLAHRLPGDVITANHAEYEYYFRNAGPAFTTDIDAATRAPATAGPHRLWLVLTASSTEGRAEIADLVLKRGWRMEDDREFEKASVFLLSRKAQN